MKTSICVNGTLRKTELMSPLNDHIVAGPTVLEATHPYAHYYGNLPLNATPNSIFLLTERFYFLEEIMGFARDLESCLKNQIDLASAIVEYHGKDIPAIRIKFFPNYENISNIQNCLLDQGVQFYSKTIPSGSFETRVQKLFHLTKISDGIYLDQQIRSEGYFFTEEKLSTEKFQQILKHIRNNTDCHLFDAAYGEMIIDKKIEEVVRVYTEPLELSLLQFLKKEFAKFSIRKQKTAVGTAV